MNAKEVYGGKESHSRKSTGSSKTQDEAARQDSRITYGWA